MDRERQHERQSREGPDLDDEVGPLISGLLGLGRDHQHLADHRDEPDEQERLDQDAAAEVDDAQRVQQLGDDEHEQHSVEEEDAGVGDGARLAALDEVDQRADERESAGDDEQDGDDEVDGGLSPADPGLEGEDVARPDARTSAWGWLVTADRTSPSRSRRPA
jgi:hypothetical protein